MFMNKSIALCEKVNHRKPTALDSSRNYFSTFSEDINIKTFIPRHSSYVNLVSNKLVAIKPNTLACINSNTFFKESLSDWFINRFRLTCKSAYILKYQLVSLVHPRNWHYSYFHWFFDIFPRAVLAQRYLFITNNLPLYYLTTYKLTEWQLSSLKSINISEENIICIHTDVHTKKLSCPYFLDLPAARQRLFIPNAVDVISPRVVQYTRDALRVVAYKDSSWPLRIYISRSDAHTRRVINEEALMIRLEKYNFCSVNLSGMNLADQISLFSNATHIIAVHGAALTNLLFAYNSAVLEIFSSGHGIRTEYFQIASIQKCLYSFAVAHSVNQFNDIIIDEQIIDNFLEISHA
jgi:hypothetical protein